MSTIPKIIFFDLSKSNSRFVKSRHPNTIYKIGTAKFRGVRMALIFNFFINFLMLCFISLEI